MGQKNYPFEGVKTTLLNLQCEYLKIPDIILYLFLNKNWTGLILLAPTVYDR